MQTRKLVISSLVAGLSFTTQAQDFPARKPGLWEIVVETAARADGMTTRFCLDVSVDKKMMERAVATDRPGVQCSKRDVKASNNSITVDSVCTIGARTTTTHVETVFQGNVSYRSIASIKYTPEVAGKSESRVVQNAKWLSACPADWKPGDMEVPGVGKININEARGAPGNAALPPVIRPSAKP